MVTSGHPAGDDRIFFKEARTLAKAGAEVTVLCAYNKEFPEQTDGVRFERYDGGGCLRERLRTVHKLARALTPKRFDVVHCHEPDGLIAALMARRRQSSKLVFDSHEMWSAVAAGRFPSPAWPVVAAGYRVVERPMIARCDGAVGASWAISEYLASFLGANRVANILNVPVTEVFGEFQNRDWGETTVLCHDGHLGFDRGLKVMAEAVRLVAARHRVRLKIVGDVFGQEREWLDGFVERHGMEGVITRSGWLRYRDVGAALAPCHIGLIALQKNPNNVVTSSNKVFNYMLYGIPFVGPDYRLSKQKLVREERCGVLADSSSADSYAGAICSMIENRQETLDMGARALQASRERYRWAHMEPLLIELYERVLGMDGSPPD